MIYNEKVSEHIPEKWSPIEFGSITTFIKGKIPSDDLFPIAINEKYQPYITIDVANDALPLYCSAENMVFCNGETIMVMDGAASGDVYIGNYGILGSTFSKISSRRSDISDALLFMYLYTSKSIYKRANTGSTVPHANKTYINKMLWVVPEDCSYYSKVLNNMFSQIENTRKQNAKLHSLRDWLIPMLMNGQATITD